MENAIHVNVGESGLMARLASPVLAAFFNEPGRAIVIDAEGTLLRRPIAQLADALRQTGLSCGDIFPLRITGRMSPSRIVVDGSGGSQAVSGLMFALPLLDAPSSVIVRNPKSVPYIRLTEEILSSYGISVTVNEICEGDDVLLKIDIPAPQQYRAPVSDACGLDWSAAANFLVAAAICGRCRVPGLSLRPTQADSAILDVLKAAGACVRSDDGGVSVSRSPLFAFEYDASQSPDLIPILSVLAVYCEGTTRIKGFDRLAGKESDRAAAVEYILSKAGVPYRRCGDAMEIDGKSLSRRILTSDMPSSGIYRTFDDHRIVMAVAVLGLLVKDRSLLPDDTAPLAKSFPSFMNELQNIMLQ